MKTNTQRSILSVAALAFILLISNIPAHAKKISIKLATAAPVNNITLTSIEGDGLSSEHTISVIFKRNVEVRSNGEIEVKIFPNSQLGSEKELWQSTQEGIIQMTTASCGALANFVPEWLAFTTPYLYDSPYVMAKVLQGPVGQKFKELVIQKIGVRILGESFLGFRHFMNSVKPIHSPSDTHGLKIRVMETPEMVKLVEGLGGQAVPIDWAELYTALQQKVVDGWENSFAMIIQSKTYEVQKYLVTDGHTNNVLPLSINEKFFQSLSPDHRRIIIESASEAITAFQGSLAIGNTLWVDELKKRGIEIYTPTPQEMQKFRDLSQKAVIPYVVSQIGQEWVDEVANAVKQAEKEYYEGK
ncbi:MAG: TRAP transporter substrate-binding protein [Desulfobacterales bacterium]|nr:MAG: TRAP transporter substrate-binding protein [Desulfobacterales bacterium]